MLPIALSGCSGLRQIDVNTLATEVDRPTCKPQLPLPSGININPLKWKVITENTLPASGDYVYYGLTVEDYKILSSNMAEIYRWVKEAGWLLKYYDDRTDERTTSGGDSNPGSGKDR